MFTPGQVSDMLEIPPSTLRRYVKDLPKHLSKTATKKRGRRFTELDIATLARARELLQQGRKPEETNKLLAVVGQEDPDAQPDSALALVPSISQALSEVQEQAQALRSILENVADNQNEANSRLEALEAWARAPSYRRIFGPPPE
ncbi:MAG: MerR family transcriptional regulator [Chloroflexi bacterium]|nr:MerR family transcriptional regulator [Chloroflexota bacterium]